MDQCEYIKQVKHKKIRLSKAEWTNVHAMQIVNE